jgi:uncharacterized protein (UPF0335 family)
LRSDPRPNKGKEIEVGAWKTFLSTYWKFKGLYDDEEVWFMSDAVRKDYRDSKDKLMHLPSYGSISKPIEEVIALLSKDEMAMFVEVLEILDVSYRVETVPMERLYYALEYVRYLRWMKYAFTAPEGVMRMNQVTYDKLVSDKMWRFIEKIDRIRQERNEKTDNVVDYEVETLPEGEVKVKKVKYGHKVKGSEAEPQPGTEEGH